MTAKGKKKTLREALAQAQALADRIPKESTNQFARFDYTSAEAMFDMWTKISEATGLVLTPVSFRFDRGEPPMLNCRWNLEHVESTDVRPLEWDWPLVTGKGKPMDKAMASARTSSLGYLIRDLLVAPRVNGTDDMDHSKWSQLEDADPAPTPPKKKAAKSTQSGAGEKSSKSPRTEATDDLFALAVFARLKSMKGSPTPKEVEAMCLSWSKGKIHPRDLTSQPDRLDKLLDKVESPEGEELLHDIRERAAIQEEGAQK